ncbi:MAG TPA: lysophospholipid acyltransferase family protein [Prolixibacteraceae bacterium]|nr:lysophospholipid acyltransferase family protein [Prolixibacteraceae bacterium]HPR59570.1 lysophospholipid acyltransferase family protein [Prolixibacteraceae bacterium]
MLNKYFQVNEYHTPENRKRKLADKLSFGTNLYFKLRFLGIVFRNRRLAVNNDYDTARWAHSSVDIFNFLEDCGIKFHIEGFEHLDAVKDEPVVFVSNHMGTLETMIFPGLVAPVKEVTFVVKESLTTNPVFGPVMRARNPIAVARKDSRADLIKVISEGQQKLAEGTSVIIFPQSTRALDFDPAKFNTLGIKLAQKAGVRVVPMAIKTDAWALGRFVKDIGYLKRDQPVHIKFGAPMSINGTGKEEHQKIVDFIGYHVNLWNNSQK